METSLTGRETSGSAIALADWRGFLFPRDDCRFIRTMLLCLVSSEEDEWGARWGWKCRMMGIDGLVGIPGGLDRLGRDGRGGGIAGGRPVDR